ncbi:CDP-6-deoxy-delta-3,4-glucoseen reductase [Caenimonas soli]|uniref:CDP-6-deoxy-delta-3,4-glucoseen reductase n=1 Tax=Caenimonas soli TaxID=2735555 RepID=UPI0015578E1A|nr:CDP-6-deoxy-delta-3,4-glucoseen reductase [Caenimonas soli]NPC55921.1 CDP-6-deoxy-delta-3,4-glucoseen reductase [Caenimonas soli]
MPFEVTLAPSGRRFQVPDGQSILKASHDAGIAVPYSCRAGACRTCRGRIVQGRVDHGHVHPLYLSLQEREQGYALLCQAQPLGDLVVEVQELDVMASIRTRVTPGRVMQIHRAAPDVMVLRIKLPMNENLTFLAGQYMEVLLPGGERRAYSIASAPSIEGALDIELHVRHTPGGVFTDHVFEHMKVRDLVRMEVPLGTFFLREDSDKPVVFLASGTGFAPIKSILQYVAHKRLARPMTLYWGGRTRADLYDLAWVKQYASDNPAFRFVPVLSDATRGCDWRGRAGFVHRAVMEDFPDLSGHQVYACGAPVVVDSAKRDFPSQCGLPPGEFFADSFLDAADRARARI